MPLRGGPNCYDSCIVSAVSTVLLGEVTGKETPQVLPSIFFWDRRNGKNLNEFRKSERKRIISVQPTTST